VELPVVRRRDRERIADERARRGRADFPDPVDDLALLEVDDLDRVVGQRGDGEPLAVPRQPEALPRAGSSVRARAPPPPVRA
jgi:hypothetical protein